MKEIVIERLATRESPREIFVQDFKSIGELPIHGGWGYSKEDAVIIDKDDPIVPPGRSFDGIGIEHVFVEKRIYEELIIFRPAGWKHLGIGWERIEQRLVVGDDDRKYDVLRFDVTAFPEAEWEALKTEWEESDYGQSPDFDHEAHQSKREAAMVHYVAEYWFDITSFFGRYD